MLFGIREESLMRLGNAVYRLVSKKDRSLMTQFRTTFPSLIFQYT